MYHPLICSSFTIIHKTYGGILSSTFLIYTLKHVILVTAGSGAAENGEVEVVEIEVKVPTDSQSRSQSEDEEG